MKIAVNALPFTSWQGIETFLYNLLKAWPETTDEVVVFANQKSASFLQPLPGHISLRIIDFKKINRVRLFIYQQTAFPRLLKKEGFDCLFCPSLFSPWFYRRQITTIHDAAPFVVPGETGLIGKIFWTICLFFIKRIARKIITVSEFSRRELIEKLKISPEKIAVVYNGAPEGKLVSNEPIVKEPISKEPALNKSAADWASENYIVAVGNARARKNLAALFSAFILLHQTHPDLKLIVTGKKDARMLELEGAWQKKTGNIVFTGFVPETEKENIIKNSAALVFPSFYEGFGLPILEANVLNAPVVCSDIPAFREVAGDSALFFDPKNEKDMADQISRVLESKISADDLRAKGKINAARFNWKKSAEQLAKIIHQTIRSKN